MLSLALLPVAYLVVGGNGLVMKDDVGKLPALGWNSWNAFECSVNETIVLTAAKRMVDLGFKDAGYEYINIDDCWSVKEGRDNYTKRLVPDPERFPDGIDGLAKKIHDMGFKFGIYSSSGTYTCQGWPASEGYEELDAETWAEWEVDYLKYDNCNVPRKWADECNACEPDNGSLNLVNGSCTSYSGLCPPGYDYSKSNTAKRYNIMRDALLAQDRPILFSLCEWGQAGVQQWGNDTGASWRMSGDIHEYWDRVVDLLNQNSFYLNHVDFWGHSDADMLEVGNGISIQESRTHFALWAAMKSPLMIGADLTKIGKEEVAIMSNQYLISFSQDKVFGKPATPYKWGTNPDWTFNKTFPAEFWSGGSVAGTLVLMSNYYDSTKNKTMMFSEIPQLGNGSYQVTNIWTGQDIGCVSTSLEVPVQAHDTAGFLVGGKCSRHSDDDEQIEL